MNTPNYTKRIVELTRKIEDAKAEKDLAYDTYTRNLRTLQNLEDDLRSLIREADFMMQVGVN